MEELLFRYNPWWEKAFKLEEIVNRPNALNELIKQYSKKDVVFLTDDKTLIEVKYKREIEKKQKELFDSINASQKFIIKSIKDFPRLS